MCVGQGGEQSLATGDQELRSEQKLKEKALLPNIRNKKEKVNKGATCTPSEELKATLVQA